MKITYLLIIYGLISTVNFRGVNSYCYSQDTTKRRDTRSIFRQCAYELISPMGWCWDEKSFSYDLYGPLFYRNNNVPDRNVLRMYIIVKSEDLMNDNQMEEYIQGKEKLMKINDSSIVIQKLNSIVLRNNEAAQTRYYSSLRDSTYKAITYIRCKGVIVEILLLSKIKEYYYSSLPAFEELVKSFRLITKYVRQD